MTLFQPDTKAKNLFLSKLSILVGKPILFDLYRFGTNFEFKYGKVFMQKNHYKKRFFLYNFAKTEKAVSHVYELAPRWAKKPALCANGKSKITTLLRKDGLASWIVNTNRLGNGRLRFCITFSMCWSIISRFIFWYWIKKIIDENIFSTVKLFQAHQRVQCCIQCFIKKDYDGQDVSHHKLVSICHYNQGSK